VRSILWLLQQPVFVFISIAASNPANVASANYDDGSPEEPTAEKAWLESPDLGFPLRLNPRQSLSQVQRLKDKATYGLLLSVTQRRSSPNITHAMIANGRVHQSDSASVRACRKALTQMRLPAPESRSMGYHCSLSHVCTCS
jgi:hypothetical protein